MAESHCSYSVYFPESQQPQLSQLAASISNLTKSLSSANDYIFHNGQQPSFTVSQFSLSTPTKYQHILGSINVSDAVDDEWYTVHLLRQVSLAWLEAVIAVDDEDGQFLLIEAAEQLPKWITPSNAENRVWIHQGHLHLIPLKHSSASPFPETSTSTSNANFDQDEAYLDRMEAVALVLNPDIHTRAPKQVEEAVWRRINGYPNKTDSDHLHKTLAYLPEEIVLALLEDPALVSEAVKAFYERDPEGIRACNKMQRFPPAHIVAPPPTSATASTPTTPSARTFKHLTQLTRPLYSQLLLQKFYPPKPFEKVNWMDLGPIAKSTEARAEDEEEKEKETRRREVGMKIACGFEIAYSLSPPPSISSQSPNAATSPTPTTPTFKPTKAYQTHLSKLATIGYFEGELEGSERWTILERKVRDNWNQPNSTTNEPFAQRVESAILRSRSKSHSLPSLANLTPAQQSELESNEDWMRLDEEGLEEILRSKDENGRVKMGLGAGDLGDSDSELESGDSEEGEEEDSGEENMNVDADAGKEEKERKKADKMAKKLEQMAGKVEQFIHGRGAVEGAEFSDEYSEDEDDEDADVEELSPEERARRMEGLVEALPASEWGQKEFPVDTAPPPLQQTTQPSQPLPSRPPKLTQNSYDGASDSSSSDDEKPEGEEGLNEESDDEDAPAVEEEGDEMDMGEEMDEFLTFATETLGLSKEQYEGILSERRGRGAFVPTPGKAKTVNVLPKSSSSSKAAAQPQSVGTAATAPAPAPMPTPQERQPLRNPNLADFDALMEQMEQELGKARKAKSSSKVTPPPPIAAKSAPNPKPTSKKKASDTTSKIVVDSSDSEGDEDEEMAEMDAELSRLFKSSEDGGGEMDLNLVKNFLASFESQGGFAGPAGNLSGRLGFTLPRNEE
ncbi:SGT1-domain-containing protein [Meredithblackwellia eburnea MCA 4105]